jgi:hypothetical protein
MTTSNRIRAYFFLSGVFKNREEDPLCRVCKAFVNSVNNARENLAAFEAEHAAAIMNLPSDLQQLFDNAKTGLSSTILPENVPGQKKAGNCKLPQGVCFVKSSLSLLQNL